MGRNLLSTEILFTLIDIHFWCYKNSWAQADATNVNDKEA